MRQAHSLTWKTRSEPLRSVRVHRHDARALPWPDESVDFILTSPPYLTAYDYADVFELPLLWLWPGTLMTTRSQIIGTRVVGRRVTKPVLSDIGTRRRIVEELYVRHPASGVAAARYFKDLDQCLTEMVRTLRHGGRLALVLGNSMLRGVAVPNTTIVEELLESAGLQRIYRGERRIGARSLPPWRDPKTGRFRSTGDGSAVPVYRTESVIIYRKP